MSKSSLYSDAAELGHISTMIGLVIGIIACVIFSMIGLYLIFKQNVHTEQIQNAKVIMTNTNCDMPIIPSDQKKATTYSCDLTLDYDCGGTHQTNINYHYNGTSHIAKGDTFREAVYCDPKNPKDISTESKNADRVAGGIFLGIGILILLFAIFRWWMSRRSKLYAATEGGVMVASAVRDVFR